MTSKLEYVLSRSKLPVIERKTSAFLHVTSAQQSQTFEVFNGSTLLGSAEDVVDLAVKGMGVSSLHAVIEIENGLHFLEDLESTNGTFINDFQLVPRRLYQLKNGDFITLGPTKCEYKYAENPLKSLESKANDEISQDIADNESQSLTDDEGNVPSTSSARPLKETVSVDTQTEPMLMVSQSNGGIPANASIVDGHDQKAAKVDNEEEMAANDEKASNKPETALINDDFAEKENIPNALEFLITPKPKAKVFGRRRARNSLVSEFINHDHDELTNEWVEKTNNSENAKETQKIASNKEFEDETTNAVVDVQPPTRRTSRKSAVKKQSYFTPAELELSLENPANRIDQDEYKPSEIRPAKKGIKAKNAAATPAKVQAKEVPVSKSANSKNMVRSGELVTQGSIAPAKISKKRPVKEQPVVADPDPLIEKSKRKRKSSASLEDGIDSSITRNSRRESTSHYRIMFTGITNLKSQYVKDIKKMGAVVVDDWRECTHLVTDKIKRTAKFLCCLAAGKYIMNVSWITASKNNNSFVAETDFYLQDKASEKKWQMNLLKSMQSARVLKIFEKFEFYATLSVTPPVDDLKDIIQAGGGKLVFEPPTVFRKELMVIGDEADYKECQALQDLGFTIYSKEIVMSSVLRQVIVKDQ